MKIGYKTKVAAITLSVAVASFIASYIYLEQRAREPSFDYIARGCTSVLTAIAAGSLSAMLSAFLLKDKTLEDKVQN